jgi:hypothetical protein
VLSHPFNGGGRAFKLGPELKFEFEMLGGKTTIRLWASRISGGGAIGVEDGTLGGLVLLASDGMLIASEFSSPPELELVD